MHTILLIEKKVIVVRQGVLAGKEMVISEDSLLSVTASSLLEDIALCQKPFFFFHILQKELVYPLKNNR